MTGALGRSIDRLAADLAAGPDLAEALAALADVVAAVPVILAVGWATVDIERAVGDLAPDYGIDGFAAVEDDRLLGARAVISVAAAGAGHDAGPRLVCLEPATEGRLAATLARRGEGPAVLYVAIDAAAEAAATAAGLPLTRLDSGPLGPARLVLGGSVWGPHLLLVRVPSRP